MVKNMLTRKLLRDILAAKWQFLSIIILSALGVLVFSGLDAAWRDIDLSVSMYFEDQQLADFWVSVPSADRDTENIIRRLRDVEDVQSRISMEVTTEMPEEPTLMLHAMDGEARINIPAVQSGETLSGSDQRGCLLERQFAQAQNLSVGDLLTVRINGQKQSFIIRGLIVSPEYVITAKDLLPEPQSYGFMIANSAAIPQVSMNEVTVLLSDTADELAVKEEIEKALPYAIVRDRNAHRSTEMIRSEVEQFKSLSRIFPLLFFAVSALIVLTTMTRMVDNQRMQIGVLKALGYRDGQILRHYLSYGFYPSLIGSCAGLLAGRYTLPGFMWGLESYIYRLPPKIVAPVSLEAFVVCGLSILLGCLICYFVCRRNFKEVSADLLRPKAPKVGSRILLERFSAFWGCLRFNAKMIQRNLFRNKVRTVMALLGVLGCTALIITALGLQDTFQNLVSTHYGQTLRYDLRVELNNDAGELPAYQKRVPAQNVEGVMEKAVSIQGGSGSRTVLLSVLEESQTLIELGTGGQSDTLPNDGIIITEKLADVMGVQEGDMITISLPGDVHPLKITVVRLVPMGMGQGLYLSADIWESFGKGAFMPTALLIKGPSANCIDYLNRLDEVERIDSIASQQEKTMTGMQSMISITVLMAAFALILAFVVLYNMGILNFGERSREFATLKVLGYHQREIRSLILRENALISCMGIVLGIWPGLWLTTLVMRASEPEDMVLSPFVSVLSVCIACGLTLAFSLMIQRLLTRKVKTIDMVEALKSVE